jgi:hypothetical protein
MCIIADSVRDVSKTNIASFHVAYSIDDNKTNEIGQPYGKTIIPSQLVVYSAEVDSVVSNNAFILPIFNPGNDTSKIIPLDFSDQPSFFNDIERIFDRWFPKPKMLSMTNSLRSASFNSNDDYLEVHQVGDYKFSLMPSKLDFNRIDRSKLNINPLSKVAIDVHSDAYSFIVYQFFQKGKIEITPFAYLCPPCSENSMIIPTIHGHPHDNIMNIGTGYLPNMYVNYKSDFEENAEFDHTIYCLVKNNAGNNIINKQDILDIDQLLRKIKTDYIKRKIRVYVPRGFVPKKMQLSGLKPNRNMLVQLNGHQYLRDLTIDGGQGGANVQHPIYGQGGRMMSY